MTTYKELERNPRTRTLFANRIRPLDEIDIDSVFISLDTEHISVSSSRDRALLQVGLACIDTLRIRSVSSKPDLDEFCSAHKVQALTLNIHLTEESRAEILQHTRIPSRRQPRIGEE